VITAHERQSRKDSRSYSLSVIRTVTISNTIEPVITKTWASEPLLSMNGQPPTNPSKLGSRRTRSAFPGDADQSTPLWRCLRTARYNRVPFRGPPLDGLGSSPAPVVTSGSFKLRKNLSLCARMQVMITCRVVA